MKSRLCTALVLCLALPPFVFADFQYQETTKVTGGSIVKMMRVAGVFSKQAREVGQPITSTVLVKGNRMAHINPDYTEIIDLDKETITRIDLQKKTYTVMTFDQLKQQMQQAAEEARRQQAEHPQANQTPAQQDQQVQMNFAVNVRNTGASKEVSGLNAKEAILTMALEGQNKQTGEKGAFDITNDMWLAPDVPGYNEVREFQRRFAQKMGMIFNQALRPSLAASNPAVLQGMGEMAKEMSKIQGTPVLQITRMGSTPDGKPLPAASEAPLPASSGPDMPSAGDVAKQGAEEGATAKMSKKLGGLGGALGGFGFGHKKKKEEEQQKQADSQQKNQPPQAGVLMETTMEMGGFSSASIDDGRFQVPAGYQQIELRGNAPQ